MDDFTASASKLNFRMREKRSEMQVNIEFAAAQSHPVERSAQIDAGHSRGHSKSMSSQKK